MGAEPAWVPTRILSSDVGGQPQQGGNALHIIGQKYLGIMQSQKLKIFRPEDGSEAGNWQLPSLSRNHHWSGMCGTSDHLYFLAQGPSPQLWRFPLPDELQSEDAQKEDMSK